MYDDMIACTTQSTKIVWNKLKDNYATRAISRKNTNDGPEKH